MGGLVDYSNGPVSELCFVSIAELPAEPVNSKPPSHGFFCSEVLKRITKAVQKLSLFLALVAALAHTSQAQGVFEFAHGEWEASVFAGGSFIGSSTHKTPVEGSTTQSSRIVGLSYGTGSQLGLRVTDDEWQHWGTAAEYSFSNQPLTFTNLSDSIQSLGLGSAIHRFSYDILYYAQDRDHKLRVFAFVGPGVSLFHIKGSGKEIAEAQGIHLTDPWKFTMNWGGGAKYLLRNQVAASIQFNDSVSGIPRYGLPETGRVVSGVFVPGFHPKGLLNNWLISAGFIYQWDER